MDKWTVARSLDEIAKYIELSEPNPFKARAFEKAARRIESQDRDIDDLVASGDLYSTPGIGKGIGPIIADLVTKGRSRYLDDLRSQFPSGIFELLRVPGLGLKKIGLLYSALGIGNLDELEAAASSGGVAKLPGFGAKTQKQILDGIEAARRRSSQFLLPLGLEVGQSILGNLAQIGIIEDAEVSGSVRRRLEILVTVDVVVVTNDRARAIAAMKKRALLDRLEEVDETTLCGFGRDEVPVSIHMTSRADSGAAMLVATGSRDFVQSFASKIAKNGYELRNRRLFHDGRHLRSETERALFERVGIPFVDPELRESGDVLGRKKRVQLLEPGDLRGTFHVHTTFSDGRNTVAEMLSAARDRGFEYVGISDHSPNAFYANGLTVDDLTRQHAEIDVHRDAAAPMRVFRGTEADILNDGAIDYGHATLPRFDFVIASIHSRFGMERAEMTARMLRALDDPFVTILGHLTGRLLLGRQGYSIDFDRVFDRAAERGVLIEINGNPHRLELDWRQIGRAVDRGVLLCINPDAHSIAELSHVISGAWVARKAGLSAKQIFNTRPVEEVAEHLGRRKREAIVATRKSPESLSP
jgi:DNA polymerase (family X)